MIIIHLLKRNGGVVECYSFDGNLQVIYHGSYVKIENSNIKEGKYNKESGDGFYCTILYEQAVRWAKKYDTTVVNVYEYVENSNLKIKEFSLMTDEWLDFIVASRNGVKHDYDIVIGVMADDQVYNYITDFLMAE